MTIEEELLLVMVYVTMNFDRKREGTRLAGINVDIRRDRGTQSFLCPQELIMYLSSIGP